MADLIYQSTKTYTHAHGYSCCFRQWRATHSHCSKLHGYALQVQLVFEGDLDERNWVQDFGGLKPVKAFLDDWFDHKTIIAEDDPMRGVFMDLEFKGILELRVMPAVGAEKFAEFIFRNARVSNIKSVEVWEHAGNSAKVIRK